MTKASTAQALLGLEDLVLAVRGHALYAQVTDDQRLRALMRSHIFAVWDFQSLLKALQREVTCVRVPWLPTADPEARRLVNEIVLDEESDETPWGGHLSHFELYHRAMIECGADTGPIDLFCSALRDGGTVDAALASARVASGVTNFVRTTLRIAQLGRPHEIAAAFSFGREDIIPEMFERLVAGLSGVEPRRWSTFRYYLERHIERDGDKHAPAARELVRRLCGSDPVRNAEAKAAAGKCLAARIALWDDVLRDVQRAS